MMRRAVPIQLKNHQDWFTCLKLPGEIYAIREEKTLAECDQLPYLRQPPGDPV